MLRWPRSVAAHGLAVDITGPVTKMGLWLAPEALTAIGLFAEYVWG